MDTPLSLEVERALLRWLLLDGGLPPFLYQVLPDGELAILAINPRETARFRAFVTITPRPPELPPLVVLDYPVDRPAKKRIPKKGAA